MIKKIVIAKPGYDAVTETNPDNLIFSSDYNTLKYHITGNVNLSGSWTTNPGDAKKTFTTSVEHGLGYMPFFICYTNFASGYNIIPFITSYMTIGTELASAWIDDNYIYFDVQLSPGIWANTWNYDFTFYYKIFKNNLNL